MALQSLFGSLRDALSGLYSPGEARAVAFLLLEEAFGVSRTDIYADKVRDFSQAETARLRDMSARLAAGEPVQYVLGHAVFRSRRFKVTPAVLIPRPETEELVEWALSAAREISSCGAAGEGLRILDAGTGSGCVAVSLTAELPGAQVEAWDISAAALSVARENAAALAADVLFREKDMLGSWTESGGADGGCRSRRYDLVVSNPPYICERERNDMEALVTDNEPARALFVPDDDPLLFYRALCEGALQTLRPGGRLLVEANRAYARDTAELFRRSGFGDVEVRRDAYGNERMVGGTLRGGVGKEEIFTT